MRVGTLLKLGQDTWYLYTQLRIVKHVSTHLYKSINIVAAPLQLTIHCVRLHTYLIAPSCLPTRISLATQHELVWSQGNSIE